MAIVRSRPGLCKRRLSTLFLLVCILALILFVGNVIKDYFTSPPVITSEQELINGMALPGGQPKRKFRHRHFKPDDDEDEIEVQVCQVPKLSLSSDANSHAYHPMPPLECTGEDLFYVRNTVLNINETVLKNRVIDRCEYQAIMWQSDSYPSFSRTHVRNTDPFELKIKHDFFKVECYLAKKTNTAERKLLGSEILNEGNVEEPVVMGAKINLPNLPVIVDDNQKGEKSKDGVDNINDKLKEDDDPIEMKDEDTYQEYQDYRIGDLPDFEQYIAQIYPTTEILDRLQSIKPHKDSLQMNVMIFALDSMSHLSYQRKLPKTYKYLKDNLEAFILNGYNIVGDATVAAMVPLLTGKREVELPEVRRGHEDTHYVDTFPFIWNKMEQSGYVTLYAEDQPSLGTFQLRLNGFEEMPVDHYMRPFWQAALESQVAKSSAQYCLGGTPQHKITLDYLRDYFLRYPSQPKFAMGFLGELSHADNNPAEYVDQDLVEFLHFLSRGKFLENTLLIVMGDHGARYSKVRATVQGKLEERLPMMSLTFPHWFHDRYPQFISNLKKNVDRLSTPFDVHETMLDLLDMSRTEKPVDHSKRSMSLLREIPKNRTCSMAGVEMHWCSCLQYEEIELSDRMAVEGASFLLDNLNQETQNHRHLCRELSLKEISDVKMVFPNEAVLKFLRSKDADQRIANFSKTIEVDIVYYQLIIHTSPNAGMYESTLQYDLKQRSWHVTSEVSRINLYNDQSHCVAKTRPSLMKYCYCNEQLPPHRQSKGGKEL